MARASGSCAGRRWDLVAPGNKKRSSFRNCVFCCLLLSAKRHGTAWAPRRLAQDQKMWRMPTPTVVMLFLPVAELLSS